MDLGLNGKRAAVAAASAGLGLASARALVAEGCRVAICSRSRERIEAAASQLGPSAVPIVADLSTPEAAGRFVRDAEQALGGIDILVANAGGPPPGTFASTDLDAYQTALDLNLMSTIAMCRQGVPAMQERKWGRVVAITSIGARQPIPYLAASTTARAGVTGFLKVLASAVAKDGVTVNSAQPGVHATDRVKQLGDLTEAARGVPAGTIGDPEDFGKVVAFLCSEPARFVTGTSLLVDGGAYRGLM